MKKKIRVIILKRAVERQKSHFWHEEGNRSWLALGQFDSISSSLESADSLFGLMEKNSRKFEKEINKDIYCKALYLFAQADSQDENLWRINYSDWFLGIIRIHFSNTIGAPKEKERLYKNLKNNLNDFNYCFYDTLELSDTVLIVQSNSFKKILDLVNYLHTISSIGKTFTYIGINLNLIKTQNFISNSDKLDYVSMHISIKDTTQASNQLHVITSAIGSSPRYSITGTDDLVLCWQNVRSDCLIEFYKNWINLNNEQCAFANIRTEIGVATNIINWVSQPQELHHLIKAQTYTYASFISAKKGDDWQWTKAASGLLSSLTHMSGTPELDEFVYLIFPSIRAFFENLRNSEVASDIPHLFVSNWNYMVESIMRTEEQLAHMPEHRPPLFDIPAALLEFLMAFISKYISLLQSVDNEPDIYVQFLLTPQLCERIEAQELFSVIDTKNGLVHVNIPFSVLRDIKQTEIVLCHEAAHFAGEVCRCREQRTPCFLKAASALIARTIFQSTDNTLIDAIYNHINADPRLANKDQKEIITLDKIQIIIADSITNLLREGKEKEYADFIRPVLESTSRFFPIVASGVMRQRNQLFFQPLLNDLYIIFREAFADLCVIHLMDLDAAEYIKGFKAEFENAGDGQLECLNIRVGVCLSVCNLSLPETYLKNDELSQIQQIMQICAEKRSDISLRMSSQVVKQLHEYLNFCFQALLKCKHEKIEEFRNLAGKEIGDKLDDFYAFIDEYRKSIFDSLKELPSAKY